MRLATLMAMLTHAVMVTASIAVTLWLSGKIAWLPAAALEWPLTPPTNIWHTAWNLAGYAWLPAYIALVLGHRRVAQAVALLAIVPPAITTAVEQATGDVPLSVSPWAMRLIDVVLLLAMAAFHHGAPPVPRRPWLLALPIGIFLVPVPLFTLQATVAALRLLDWPGLSCAVVTVAILVHLVVHNPSFISHAALVTGTHPARRDHARPANRNPAWLQRSGARTTLVTIASVEVIAVLAVGVPLAVLAIRALRRLPPIPAVAQRPTTPT